MTEKYIRTAEAVGEVIGAVFPALPASLLSPLNGLANRLKDPQAVDFVVEAPGIEPGACAVRADAPLCFAFAGTGVRGGVRGGGGKR
jgi:hypothetical protein